MDVVNLSRSRRFLRERPIRVTLFDRPRLVCDLVCLEAEQNETRPAYERSDSMYLIVEGKCRLRAGPQIEDLEEMDAVLVPPGVEHYIENTGAGRLTAMVLVTPKPTRASDLPAGYDRRPAPRSFRGPPDFSEQAKTDERAFRVPRRPAAAPARGPRRAERGPRHDERVPANARPRGAGTRRTERSNEGEGPVWYPRPKTPSYRGRRPAGDGPATGRGAQASRSRPTGRPRTAGPPRTDERPRARPGEARGSTERSGGRFDDRGAGGPGRGRPANRAGPERGARGGTPGGRGRADQRPTPRGRGPTGRTGGNQSGRRGPGRSGPRT
jgi:hypothetical protein